MDYLKTRLELNRTDMILSWLAQLYDNFMNGVVLYIPIFILYLFNFISIFLYLK